MRALILKVPRPWRMFHFHGFTTNRTNGESAKFSRKMLIASLRQGAMMAWPFMLNLLISIIHFSFAERASCLCAIQHRVPPVTGRIRISDCLAVIAIFTAGLGWLWFVLGRACRVASQVCREAGEGFVHCCLRVEYGRWPLAGLSGFCGCNWCAPWDSNPSVSRL